MSFYDACGRAIGLVPPSWLCKGSTPPSYAQLSSFVTISVVALVTFPGSANFRLAVMRLLFRADALIVEARFYSRPSPKRGRRRRGRQAARVTTQRHAGQALSLDPMNPGGITRA